MSSIYQLLVRADRSDQSVSEQRATARNGLRQITAESLQASGDHVVSARTVLPWLLTSLGAPAFLLGLLVPIRESLSMLPQAALAPWVRSRRRRRGVWVAGAIGQALATFAMAFAGATLDGTAAGLVIVASLAAFALSRSLCSLASKDVLGRTIPHGERGQITGVSTLLSGAVAVTLGVGIRVLGGDDVSPGVLAVILAAGGIAWLLGAGVFGGIREPEVPAEERAAANGSGWARAAWSVLRDDAPFRRFVLARALLLVSALSPPFVVALAAQSGETALAGLGPFVIAQGLASLIGGRFFGRMADRSSRDLMMWSAAFASGVIAVLLLVLRTDLDTGSWWLFPGVYLLLALTHTASRVARKTYVVDLADDASRTEYVAVANTAMGVVLLVAGAISGGLATLGHEAALAFLAVVGVVGVVTSRTLPEVSRRD